MAEGVIELNNKINGLLNEVLDNLYILMNKSNDLLMLQNLEEIKNKTNLLIDENKKYLGLIKNDLSKLDKSKENKENIQEKEYDNGKYIGQLVNDIREGKGIYYYNHGDKYEGDWKNGRQEGKGTYYFASGEKYEGEWK